MLILIKRLEDIQSEQLYLKSLRQEEAESDGEAEETEKIEEEELVQRIAEDPNGAARYYQQIAKVTKAEFK